MVSAAVHNIENVPDVIIDCGCEYAAFANEIVHVPTYVRCAHRRLGAKRYYLPL